MRIMIVDGSQKGIVLGAGLVVSDEFGFLSFESNHRLHIEATPELAEVFALECALSFIEREQIREEVLIITDCLRLESVFAENAPAIDMKKRPYHAAVQRKLQELRECTMIRVKWANGELQPYVKLAHEQSRAYLKKPELQRLTATVPLVQLQKTENKSTVKVLLQDKRWFVFFDDEEISSGRSFLGTILAAVTSLQSKGAPLVLDEHTMAAVRRCTNSDKARKIIELVG